MKPSDFDLQTGVASLHWALVPTEDPLDAERDCLREDLIQVVLDSGVILDVGWYPSFSVSRRFRIVAVRDDEWDTPALVKECRTLRSRKTRRREPHNSGSQTKPRAARLLQIKTW